MVLNGTKKRPAHTEDAVWDAFVQQEGLTQHQLDQFKAYADLLVAWNKKVNLTRITGLDDIVAYHFQDSLRIVDYVDLDQSKGLVDVGTGAGFPGVPLALIFPKLPVLLLEVNNKKIAFLKELIKRLELPNVQICEKDWRTFLRTTEYPVDTIVARASVKPEELVRAFKPSCVYQDATVIYWASGQWKCPPELRSFFKKEQKYGIKKRAYTFIFFGKPE